MNSYYCKRAAQVLAVTLLQPSPTTAFINRPISAIAFSAPHSNCSPTAFIHHQRTLCHRSPSSHFSSTSNIQQESTMASQIKNRVALLQFHVSYDKSQNIVTARQYITKAREAGARLCVLPECWNSPYATAAFGEYSENLPKVGDGEGYWGPSTQMLVEMAKSSNMYILVVNPDGMIVGKHRKVHLFDIDVPGGITFIESETLSAGDGATYFDMDENDESGLGRIGVGIW